jgi:flagellar protein FlaG
MSTDGINPLAASLLLGDTKVVAAGKDQAAGARAENPAVGTAERAGAEEQPPVQPKEKQVVEDITKVLNESARLFNISLQFRVDEDIDRIIVSVFDKDTEKVIRQVPPEEVIELSKSLDRMAGLLFNETA